MGTTVLTIALLIEAALAAVSLVTKSHREKTRSVLRIVAFAVFLSFTLSSVIEWRLRWYGLAALLFVWAARGLWALFNSKTQETEYKTRTVVLRSVTAMLLVFIAVTPALIFPQYILPEATGNYEVGTVQYTLVDESRIERYSNTGGYRKLNVECWHPKNADDKYPLVVFSHGGLGTNTSNESLYIELASHGYMVCSIDHAYHSFWTKFEDGTVAWLSMDYFQELQREDAKTDKQQSYEYYQKWLGIRTDDINFVMDAILEKASNNADGVYSLIDVENIGVMGHSLGGSAALAIPRQRDDVDAVIALESPFLYDIVGVKNNEFVWLDEAYPVPVLNIYADASWSHLSEWAQYARNYELLSDSQARASNVHISGAGHFSLTDLPLASPLLVRLLEGGEATGDSEAYLPIVNKVCLEFFDRYLKERGEFTSYGLYRDRRLHENTFVSVQ